MDWYVSIIKRYFFSFYTFSCFCFCLFFWNLDWCFYCYIFHNAFLFVIGYCICLSFLSIFSYLLSLLEVSSMKVFFIATFFFNRLIQSFFHGPFKKRTNATCKQQHHSHTWCFVNNAFFFFLVVGWTKRFLILLHSSCECSRRFVLSRCSLSWATPSFVIEFAKAIWHSCEQTKCWKASTSSIRCQTQNSFTSRRKVTIGGTSTNSCNSNNRNIKLEQMHFEQLLK